MERAAEACSRLNTVCLEILIFDVGAEDSLEGYWLKGSKCSIMHRCIQSHNNNLDQNAVQHLGMKGFSLSVI